MKKFALLTFAIGALIRTTLSFAQMELPTIPENCFQDTNYCYNNSVVDNEEGKRVIRVRLFTKFDPNEYSSAEELIGKFFAFDQWPAYAEGSDDDVRFIQSKELAPVVINGQTVRRHLANYVTKAPFPIRKMEVYEIANYYKLPAARNALLSYKFVADLSQPGSKGLKHKVGIIHLEQKPDTQEYYVYLTIDVIPSIDLLPTIAAPYIEKAMMGIFLGMFNLR